MAAATHADQQRAFEEGTFLPQENVRDVALDFGAHGHTNRRRRRPTSSEYRRITYARQRIRQWAGLDPVVPAEDWDKIVSVYREHGKRRGTDVVVPTGRQLRIARGKPIPGCTVLTKPEIRSLLHACDAVEAERLGEVLDELGLEDEHSFTRRYLKQWIFIRWKLSGYGGTGHEAGHAVIELLLDDFPRVEEAFRQAVQSRLPRKSLLPYNDVFGRLLQLHGLEELRGDFPALRTRRARKKSLICWWFICMYWGWPFLEDESKILQHVLKLK